MWENYSSTFCEITYVPTFIQIKKRCEEKQDVCSKSYLKASSASLEEEEESNSQQTSSTSASPIQNEQWKKEKEYDNDEAFFSRDDDEVGFLIFMRFID